MELLKYILNRIHPTEEAIVDEYLSYWKPAQYRRKAFIIMEGETEQYLYFVLDGVQKTYFLDNNNKENIIAFYRRGSFLAGPKSLLTQTPSTFFTQCLADSKFLFIPYTRHLEMLNKHKSLNTLFRVAIEITLIGVIDRYRELMSFTIEERFRSFAKRSPQLLNLIPQKDLASYLRIDPTNYSKLINSVKI